MIGKSCKTKTPGHASARVVDGKLILSLPAANTPVVWQMDLGQAKASALEIRSNAESGLFTLTLKTPKGETMEIASFNERERSLEGLMAASRALENAHGQIKQSPGANDSALPVYTTSYIDAETRAPKKGRAWIFILVLAALFGLFMFWSSQMPLQVSAPATGSAGGASSAGAPSPSMNGVPMSADMFLQNQ